MGKNIKVRPNEATIYGRGRFLDRIAISLQHDTAVIVLSFVAMWQHYMGGAQRVSGQRAVNGSE
jgi:hypothetical protein